MNETPLEDGQPVSACLFHGADRKGRRVRLNLNPDGILRGKSLDGGGIEFSRNPARLSEEEPYFVYGTEADAALGKLLRERVEAGRIDAIAVTGALPGIFLKELNLGVPALVSFATDPVASGIIDSPENTGAKISGRWWSRTRRNSSWTPTIIFSDQGMEPRLSGAFPGNRGGVVRLPVRLGGSGRNAGHARASRSAPRPVRGNFPRADRFQPGLFLQPAQRESFC